MFDLEMVARITGGGVIGRKSNRPLSGISTDSRNLEPGSLFVPLRGERFDGHDYIGQAVRNGAAACLSEEVIAGLTVPVVRVSDTLKALGDIAATYRLQLNGPLVAITGSAGKTTTKEMLATILGQVAPGLKTAGNYNNLIGLPLTLLQLKNEHQWAVIEMGTSALGEIERLTEIAQPSIGVITNIGAAHLETLHGLDGVSRAKGELFAGLHGGTAVINLDDPRVAQLPVANGVKKLTFGVSEQAQIRGSDIVETAQGVEFSLQINDQSLQVRMAVHGRHNVLNALAAAAAAVEMEVPHEKIVSGLEMFAAVNGRSDVVALADGGTLIDDSYNSNPLSAAASLETLKALPGSERRIAVLGDMLELGENSVALHEDLGQQAAQVADLVIAVGQFAGDICRGCNMAVDQCVAVENASVAGEVLLNRYCAGDRVLVKGSRGVHLEQVAEELKSAVAAEKKGN